MQQGQRILPSPALVIAVLALIVALGGSAYAASKIGTSDIKDRAVTGAKIDSKAVKGTKIRGESIKSGKIKDDTIKQKKLVPEIQERIDEIDGKQDACAAGAVLAYAEVESSIGGTFTEVDGYNCKGGTVEARKSATGDYELRWEDFVFDDPADGIVALINPLAGNGGTITGYETTNDANLRVRTYANDGSDADRSFSVAVLDAGPQE